MVTTPADKPVAMVHCNNYTSDIDAWAELFQEATEVMGQAWTHSFFKNRFIKKRSKGTLTAVDCLHTTIEPITGLDEGRLLFARMPDSRSTLANFMRTLLFSVLGTLRIGIDKLYEKERVKIDKILGYGSFLKIRIAGQKLIAAALNTPVAVMETAGEGGSWGMALLAEYMCHKEQGKTLENYLENRVFKGEQGAIAVPDPKQVQSFACFTERYKKGLAIEHAAVETMKC